MVKAYINGTMEDNLKGIGKIIKWMDSVFSVGQMEEGLNNHFLKSNLIYNIYILL
jgi:hypothetical protein